VNKLVEYTKQALETNRVRVIGVCFGHQIIGRAMGVKVGRNDGGWEAAVTDVQLTEKGKEVFGVEKLVGAVGLDSSCGY
jgi:GMP synthase-like glutamine amidotransferase